MTGSVAPGVQQVRVLSVDEDKHTAVVRTTLGKEMTVSTAWQRAAYIPKSGERWLIDQSLGRWSFAALVGRRQAPPAAEITLDSLADVDMVGKQAASTIVWSEALDKWTPGTRENSPDSYSIGYGIQNPETVFGWSSSGSAVSIDVATLNSYIILELAAGVTQVHRNTETGGFTIEAGVWAISIKAAIASPTLTWGDAGTYLDFSAGIAVGMLGSVDARLTPPDVGSMSSAVGVFPGGASFNPDITGEVVANGGLTGLAQIDLYLSLTKIREVF